MKPSVDNKPVMLMLEALPQLLAQAQSIADGAALDRFLTQIDAQIESGQLIPGSDSYLSSMVVTGSLCRRWVQKHMTRSDQIAQPIPAVEDKSRLRIGYLSTVVLTKVEDQRIGR